ncbi:hypothetical protein GN958_ATG13682, partial [Phytophthora infestans]
VDSTELKARVPGVSSQVAINSSDISASASGFLIDTLVVIHEEGERAGPSIEKLKAMLTSSQMKDGKPADTVFKRMRLDKNTYTLFHSPQFRLGPIRRRLEENFEEGNLRHIDPGGAMSQVEPEIENVKSLAKTARNRVAATLGSLAKGSRRGFPQALS